MYFSSKTKVGEMFSFLFADRSGYPLVRPFAPPAFLPLLCFPTPALALVFITPFLVFACRARPLPSLFSLSSLASTPMNPMQCLLLVRPSSQSPPLFLPPPPLLRLCLPSIPSSFCCFLFKPSRTPFFLCPWLSPPPASIAIVWSVPPPSFRRACLAPSFVDFPFLIRTPFFLSVCILWCVLPLVVGVGGVAKPRRRGKGTGTLKVRVPRRTGGEGVERGRKGGLFWDGRLCMGACMRRACVPHWLACHLQDHGLTQARELMYFTSRAG